MKSDHPVRNVPVERQGEEYLRRHSLAHKFWDIPKPEFSVVIRMSNQTTSSRMQFSKPSQAFIYQRLAHTLPLELG